MNLSIGLAGSALLVGGLYATDALAPGRTYDIPLEQAFDELSSMPVPDGLAATGAGAAPAVVVERTPSAIHWQFRVRGQDVALFTARLTPEGAGRTRVRIEYSPREPSSPELRRLASAGLVREFARLEMSEHVEARLERRPVDRTEVAAALADHIAANPEQVREYGRAMGEMVADLHRQINENAPEGLAAPGSE